MWLQSDPIPFIIKNFYGSSPREEGLTYLTCSRRPLLIQSWLRLPLLLIPVPTRKPESWPQWAAVVLQTSPRSLGPSHSCSLCLELPSSTFSAKKWLPLKTSPSSSYTLYKHTHNLTGSSLVSSWITKLLQYKCFSHCCKNLSPSLETIYLQPPAPSKAPLSLPLENIYCASLISPAKFPRVILRVMGSTMDQSKRSLLLDNVEMKHPLKMNNMGHLGSFRAQRNIWNHLVLLNSHL